MSFFSRIVKTVDNFSKPKSHPLKIADILCGIFSTWEGIAKRNDLSIKYLLNHVVVIDWCYGLLASAQSDYVNKCGGKINEVNYYAEVCNNLWSEYKFFSKSYSNFMNNREKYDKYVGVAFLSGQAWFNERYSYNPIIRDIDVYNDSKREKTELLDLLNNYVTKYPELTI